MPYNADDTAHESGERSECPNCNEMVQPQDGECPQCGGAYWRADG